MGFWINFEITISGKESDKRFYSHVNKPQLGVAWRKTYLENRSSLVISHIFVGSIPVISDQRIKERHFALDERVMYYFRLRSFASLCSAVQYFWGRWSFQIRYAAHFLHGLAMFFLRDSLSVRSFLIAAMTRYSGFFQLSLVTRFACVIGQLARIWIWVSSGVITICI